MLDWARDQTIWGTVMRGRACDRTICDADVRMGVHPSEGPVDPGTGGWETAMPGSPGPAVRPPARRRGESRDSRMLDWDATA